MSHKEIKWGILGTSFISEVMVHAIRESKKGNLTAVAGRSISKIKKFATDFKIEHDYDDYQALLNSPDIDAVYIGLPNHLHKEWIIRAAQAGKHILCEKPFAISENEVHDVMNVVSECNVFCMEAIMYRCHPLTKKLRELIQNNIIGNIRLFQANYNANIAAIANPVEGGAIRNLGCYPVSLVRYLANAEPIEISGMGTNNQASVMLKFQDNVMATISTADDLEMSWQFDIYGTEGVLKILSNPWLPALENRILIQRYDTASPLELNVTADKSLYTYQIDIVNHAIISESWSDHDVVPLSESLGNTIVLEEWRKCVA